MKFERAILLGAFCKQLGIDANARIALAPAKGGLRIWDLNAEMQHLLGPTGETVESTPRRVPAKLKTILAEPDSALRKRLSKLKQRQWSEEYETVWSELHYRRIEPEIADLSVVRLDSKRTSGRTLLKWLSRIRFWKHVRWQNRSAMKE